MALVKWLLIARRLRMADKDRNVSVITDIDNRKIVVINDVVFKGKRKIDWKEVRRYLREFVGNCYEVEENAGQKYIRALVYIWI